MAATITNFIDRIQLGNDETHQIAIGSSAYGICNTAAIEPAKTANIPGFYLNPGTTVHIKFNNANSAASPTLNISSTGAKPIIQYDNTPVGIIDETTGWQAGAILTLTYDGTSWVRDQGYNTNSQSAYGNITTSGALSTASSLVVTDADKKITTGATLSATINSQTSDTKFLREDGTWAKPSYTKNTNTHRPIQINSTQILGDDVTALNLIEGTNIDITNNGGNVTIAAPNLVKGNGRVFYGICDTEASTANKEVSCSDYDILTLGDILIVKFNNTNSAAVADLTLSIKIDSTNSTTAKSIKKQYNTTGNNNLTTVEELNANGIAVFVYNGTYWILTNTNYNINAWSDITNKPTKITLTGAITGEVSLDSGDLSLTTAVNHNHDSSYVAKISSSTDNAIVRFNGTNGQIQNSKIIIDDNGNLKIAHTTSATMDTTSTNPQIIFSESGTQPVHLIYTDYDNYRNPAGLKVIGGSSASPAWFEVEGSVFINSGNRVPHTGNTTGTVGSDSQPVYINAGTITSINQKKTANALINALDTGSSNLTSDDYIITQYVGGGTTTTTYHRRPANKVINATLVKAALGVVTNTDNKFLKDTGEWVKVDWDDLTGKPTTLQDYGITDALSSSTIVNRVKQSAVTSNLDYTLLFSAGDPNVQNSVDPTSGEDQEAAYYTGLTFNPHSKTLSIYNGSTTGTLTATEYSGNAATATEASNVEWTNVNNKPSIVNSIQVGSSIKTGALTLADLGLANAMHFIGVVASNSANTPSDGTGGYPTIQGLSSYTPTDGDVVIDKDLLREYVWNGSWILLGFTASSIYDSNNIAVSETAVNVPTWVSRIQQATDGKITIERETIGTLPVNHGGTGVTSFTNDCVIVATGSTQTLVSRALKVTEDNSSNLTITNNEANKNITISANGTGTMSINSTTGTLTISSTTGKLTVSSNYGSLIIQGGKNIKSTLTLGNATKSSSATGSEGSIVLYSADTNAHTIVGASTTANYTHTLPKQTGWFVSAASSGVATDGKTLIYIASTGITTASTQTEGSGTQPVYLNSGTLTALTYTANRLYYSASTSSFEATNHTATADTLALHKTTAITSGYTFEVNGKTNLLDDLTIASGKNIDIGGSIQISGNIIPATDQTSVLGSNDSMAPKRWSALYIGTADTYGGTTQPIWWDNGVPKALTFTPYRLYYSASSTSFTATDHYATSTQLILNAPSSVSSITDTLYVNGTTYLNGTSYLNGNSTIAGNFVPSSDNSYDLGSSGTNACTWKNIYVKTADLDNIDALSSTITIGYNNTSSINMYYSGIANTHTNIFSINDTGIVFPILTSAGNSPKISWSGANDDAAIYYKVATVNNANVGRLVINTNDSSCLIALTQNNADKIYINTNTPSIYPQTTNKGTLGTTNNRWQKVYIGTANSYGDAYTPIYWNNGVPAAVTTIQREAFSFTVPAIAGDPSIINSDSTNVTDNSEVVEIVVETGIQYLNSIITWEIVNGNNNTKQIQLTATVTGTVTGYILFRK